MNDSTPKVSVVIPCYNLGQYLDEAIDSVLSQTFQDFEITIVNDGSTDENTIAILQVYNKPKTRVIHAPNQGVSAARNTGIKASSGKYILCLDADDKIGSTYLEKAVEILDSDDNIKIVDCDVELFGDRSGKCEFLPKYHFPSILIINCIYPIAIFRKSDWQKTNGFNPNMIYSWEDHDFWLSIIELGGEVVRIPEALFFYRQRYGSRDKSIKEEQYIYLFSQLFKNHPKLYYDNIEVVFKHILDLRSVVWQLQDKLEESQAQLTIYSLNLKKINLIIFPDWSQKEEFIFSQLKEVIIAILSHDRKEDITLLIDVRNIRKRSELDANLILSGVIMSISMEEGLDVTESLEISPIGELSTMEWKTLLPHITYRIVIDNEDRQAIAETGAENIMFCELESLSKI